jgi:hypothetical protein
MNRIQILGVCFCAALFAIIANAQDTPGSSGDALRLEQAAKLIQDTVLAHSTVKWRDTYPTENGEHIEEISREVRRIEAIANRCTLLAGISSATKYVACPEGHCGDDRHGYTAYGIPMQDILAVTSKPFDYRRSNNADAISVPGVFVVTVDLKKGRAWGRGGGAPSWHKIELTLFDATSLDLLIDNEQSAHQLADALRTAGEVCHKIRE